MFNKSFSILLFSSVLLSKAPTLLEYNLSTNDVKMRIAAGADVNAKDKWGRTPLHYALYQQPYTAKIAVLIEAGADVKVEDAEGRTLLDFANDFETMEALVKAGADINVQDANGDTHLHKAPTLEWAEDLVKAGARVDIKNNQGKTPSSFVVVAFEEYIKNYFLPLIK
jgi:ankyrin repeat protein